MNESPQTLVRTLLAIEDFGAQKRFIDANAQYFSEEACWQLKMATELYFDTNLDRARAIGDLLLYLAEIASNDVARALGLLVKANVHAAAGLGEYLQGIELYDQAAEIYRRLGRPADQARSQVGKVFALQSLGRHSEAAQLAAWASSVFEACEDWLPLAKLTSNLGISYSHQGNDLKSLEMFDRARDYSMKLPFDENSFLPNAELNRSIALRDLGRFEESMTASQTARDLLLQTGRCVEAARALQSLATTYFVVGKYNEALTYLDQVKQEFLADKRVRDAMRVDLYVCDCLLQLHRHQEVLDKCEQSRKLFSAQGVQYEVAQAVLFEAIAYTGLQQYDNAWRALGEASQLFLAEGNHLGDAHINLQKAAILALQRRYPESLALAQQSSEIFATLEKPVEEAYAHLAAARALLALDQMGAARTKLDQACTRQVQHSVPALVYQCRYLEGAIAAKNGDAAGALANYDQAIEVLEHLRGRLMLEFRASYVEDKQAVYADAVLLCLETGCPEQALDYVEKAKSRSLLDLLAHRLELRVHARALEDQPLLDELMRLRAERDNLYRRWEGNEEIRKQEFATLDEEQLEAQRVVVTLEKRITELWHALLIRNADYATDAALWQTRIEPIRQLLPEGAALIEYFEANGAYIVFAVTHESVAVQRLAVDIRQVQQQLRVFKRNLGTVPTATTPAQLAALTANVQPVLEQMYRGLVQPIAEQIAPFKHLIIVPHGALHYVPFHALRTGGRYLLEEYEISYLPSGSFLRYCTSNPIDNRPALAFGHSNNHLLPHAVAEATEIGALMGGHTFVEGEATKEQLRRYAADASILHFATHAEFRTDNPLFSGLYLEDGWLTTLDVFDLKLAAALVTLSACQTGRSVIGGGDELLGLMRAFISSGASSLVLSHWPVEDASAAQLMGRFYRNLAAGWSKRAALRDAQCALLAQAQPGDGAHQDDLSYAHPYFWAAFFLVGDTGVLARLDWTD